VTRDELFERACYLSELLKREEYIKQRISKENREFFEQVIQFMIDKRILIPKQGEPDKILLRTSGES